MICQSELIELNGKFEQHTPRRFGIALAPRRNRIVNYQATDSYQQSKIFMRTYVFRRIFKTLKCDQHDVVVERKTCF